MSLSTRRLLVQSIPNASRSMRSSNEATAPADLGVAREIGSYSAASCVAELTGSLRRNSRMDHYNELREPARAAAWT